MQLLKEHHCFGGTSEFFSHESQQTGTTMNFALHRPHHKNDIAGGLIWLSGLTCNEENFITKAGAQRILSELNLAIICPDTSPRGLNLPGEHDSYDFGSGAGFYVDATTPYYKDHYRMYSYINDEIYNIFDQQCNLNGRISLFGHSMGGHGALMLGLKNPQRYKSISAFAPITHPSQCDWGTKAFNGYLGEDQSTWAAYDACKLLSNGQLHANSILIDQGLADEFYPQQLLTDDFEKACIKVKQPLKVNYHANYDHSYYFIATFLENHLRHHAKFLLDEKY